MSSKRIVTATSTVTLGCATEGVFEKTVEYDCNLISLASNVPHAGMVYFHSITLGCARYSKDTDDAVLYYPLVEYLDSEYLVCAKGKRECRRLEPIQMIAGESMKIEYEYSGWVPPGTVGGWQHRLIVSLEVEPLIGE